MALPERRLTPSLRRGAAAPPCYHRAPSQMPDMTAMNAARHALAGLLIAATAPAFAESAPAAFELTQLLPMLVIFVLFYFMLIRPQMKRAKEHKQMVDALQVGDEVVTGGGMLGKVTKVAESYITVEIAKDTRVVVQRPSIQTVLPKGSITAA